MAETRDDELLHEAKKNESRLLTFFRRQGVSAAEEEDLLQETYLRLWRYRSRYAPVAKLSTFLFLLARQVSIDALRRRTRRTAREEAWGRERGDVVPARVSVREDVRWALARLSPPLRAVVELGVLRDLPYARVAEILGIPTGTVKSRMSNALKKLKEVLDDERS